MTENITTAARTASIISIADRRALKARMTAPTASGAMITPISEHPSRIRGRVIPGGRTALAPTISRVSPR